MGFSPYTLKGIRDRIYAEADYAPSKSAEAQKRVDEFINRAYYRLLLDAPFLFWIERYQFPIYPDITAGANDTLRLAINPAGAATKDPWVLESVSAVGSTTTVFNTQGLWNGRRIFLYDSAGDLWHERRIREVWSEGAGVVGDEVTRYFISLDRPLATEEVFADWIVEMGAYNLPHSVVQVKSLMDIQSGLTREITVVPEGQGEHGLLEPSLAGRFSSNLSSHAYRREHRKIAAPTFEPAAAEVLQTTWVGPEPTGSFEYCFTYVWGYQDGDFRMLGPETQDQVYTAGTTIRSEPWLESPPSKVSAEVAHTGANTINVTLPDVDFVHGFADSGTRRYRRTGLKKRIYRRRLTSTATATVTAFGRNVETPDSFYLIAEVDGHEQTWTDDGSQTPDYTSPLQPVHGYQTLQFYPRPSNKRFILMRAVRRPPPLEDDQAYPWVHEEAMDALINRALVHLHRSKGDPGSANQSLAQYEEDIRTLTKTYGTAVPGKTARNISLARASNKKKSIARWMLTRSPG